MIEALEILILVTDHKDAENSLANIDNTCERYILLKFQKEMLHKW